MIRRPLFWIVLLAASLACAVATLRNFELIFPLLDAKVGVTGTEAIAEARRLNASLGLSRAELAKAVANFSGEQQAQIYIEQEAGGREALKPYLGEDEHGLYAWRARLFRPGLTEEVNVFFTPGGRAKGFEVKLPEAAPGAALEAARAREIAVARAAADWGVDFARYKQVSASSARRTGGRVDHELQFERTDAILGEARLRLRLVVGGDRLIELKRFIQVPEAFARRYQEVRSTNNTIAAIASAVAMLIYGIGGCALGTIWLVRRRSWHWKKATAWAAVVALLLMASSLDAIPGAWLQYDTAVPPETFLALRIAGAVAIVFLAWPMFTLIFATGEGLGREAFGSHPQLWRAWSPAAGASRAILGRTLAGYAFIGFDLAYIGAFYYFTQSRLGWWSPGEMLIDPNIISHPLPWIAPLAMALTAGMWEEFFFRAIPLAGAALLGRRYGKERLFLAVALIVQAIVFGCAHANYPQHPAYARPVELFLPSIVWGLMYLRFGILPGMLMHFGFDLTLMSMPLFVTQVPGIGVDRAVVAIALLVPLAVVAWCVARAGKLLELDASDRNAAFVPAESPIRVEAPPPEAAVPSGFATGRNAAILVMVLGLAGAVGYAARLTGGYDAPGLSVDRPAAIRIAEDALRKRAMLPGPEWTRIARTDAPTEQLPHYFAWKEGGPAVFASLIGNYLAPPVWLVRFARFEGDAQARAESWIVSVAGNGEVRTVIHNVPEAREGSRLDREDAKAIADRYIAQRLGLDPAGLRLVSGKSTARPKRTDWEFVYADPKRVVPAGGEARITVNVGGDQVLADGRSLFVPEAWERQQKARANLRLLVGTAAGLAIALVIGTVVVLAIRRYARHEASRRAALWGALGALALVLAIMALSIDATIFRFDTAQPLSDQLLRQAIIALLLAVLAALVAGSASGAGVRYAAHAEIRRASIESTRRSWRDAAALGLFVGGLGGLVQWLSPAGAPRLPIVSGADEWSPAIGAALMVIAAPLVLGCVTTFAESLASRSGWRAWLTAIFFVAVGAMMGSRGPDFTATSIFAGAAVGAALYGLYRVFVLPRTWLVPRIATVMLLLGAVRNLLQPVFPGSVLAGAISIAAVMVGYLVWRKLVMKDLAQGPATAPR